MNNETIELINRYVKAVQGKDVYLELNVNAESPVVKIRGIGFKFIFAGHGYFRSMGKAENVRNADDAFEFINRYVEEEAE